MRVTDKNFRSFIGNGGKPFVLLFESRFDTAAASMIEAFHKALEKFEPDVLGGVCMVEEGPELAKRMNVHGVPTVVAASGERILGETLGARSADQLVVLVQEWLSRAGLSEKEES